MILSRLAFSASALFLTLTLWSARPLRVSSPDGQVTIETGVKDHKAYYAIDYKGERIVQPSRLGFVLDDGAVGLNCKVTGSDRDQKDETWTQVWGEDENVRNHYHELCVHFLEKTGIRRKMTVVFRAFNDGIGFRYILPDANGGQAFSIMDEQTEFMMSHDANAWSIPSNHTEYFEGIYTRELLSKKDTVCTPLTIEYGDSLFIAIHEAALEDYSLAKRSQSICPGRYEKPLAYNDHRQECRRTDHFALDAEPERALPTDRHLMDRARPIHRHLVEHTQESQHLGDGT